MKASEFRRWLAEQGATFEEGHSETAGIEVRAAKALTTPFRRDTSCDTH